MISIIHPLFDNLTNPTRLFGFLKVNSDSPNLVPRYKLEDALDNDELIEIWEANLDEAGTTTGTYKGMYFQGYLTEIERNSNAEDMVEVSTTFGINGTGKRGDVTVTADQQAAADYVFKDSTKTGA